MPGISSKRRTTLTEALLKVEPKNSHTVTLLRAARNGRSTGNGLNCFLLPPAEAKMLEIRSTHTGRWF